ncbi:hypothetical protein RB195_010271 [Necator americanus]|uniref:Uncharacterized protein n=1 Tax=Necator americanus TaxID=51031 RepID=A0ABR1CX70_NECAM
MQLKFGRAFEWVAMLSAQYIPRNIEIECATKTAKQPSNGGKQNGTQNVQNHCMLFSTCYRSVRHINVNFFVMVCHRPEVVKLTKKLSPRLIVATKHFCSMLKPAKEEA